MGTSLLRTFDERPINELELVMDLIIRGPPVTVESLHKGITEMFVDIESLSMSGLGFWGFW